MSLTDEAKAGFENISEASSSIIVILSPPKAAACALIGKRRKLYSV